MAEPSKAVLVTGCSSGIGRASALRLAAHGWTVYATARRPETIAELGEAGCRTLALDVTDEDSMRAAVATVEQAEGAVGVLINNAGYSQSGAIETVPIDAVRRQFETNVFGLVLPEPSAQTPAPPTPALKQPAVRARTPTRTSTRPWAPSPWAPTTGQCACSAPARSAWPR